MVCLYRPRTGTRPIVHNLEHALKSMKTNGTVATCVMYNNCTANCLLARRAGNRTVCRNGPARCVVNIIASKCRHQDILQPLTKLVQRSLFLLLLWIFVRIFHPFHSTLFEVYFYSYFGSLFAFLSHFMSLFATMHNCYWSPEACATTACS